MPRNFEVVGYDDDDEELEGDVMGDVMGYGGPMGDLEGEDDDEEVVGYDDEGIPIVVGARRRLMMRRRPRRRVGIRVRKPNWRRRQLAPGVIAPDQGMLPLPLSGDVGNQFTAAITQISFEGQIQKPFRGERLLVSTVRNGVTAVGRVVSQLFVGTDLQQLDVPEFDAEQVGQAGAFGVRLTMKPAQPGVFIRLVSRLNFPLTAPDTVDVTVTLLGRLVH